MKKGMILYQGIVVGEIERVAGRVGLYRFTYDPSFDEYYHLDDMEIRAAPYELDYLPGIMHLHLNRISPSERQRIQSQSDVTDDLDLWLTCCKQGLIPEDDGYCLK